MKKTVLFVTMLLAVSAQGQLVDSGFEDWTAGSPDGWNGARTNMTIPAEQVSDDVHGGASAVRLNRTESGHQRFTTQALSVTSGTEYEVSFWVRGSGEIRVGLYDERSTGFGYFYGSWHVATATWTQVTEVVTAVQTSSIAEFILSVHLTAPDQHIVVDDVLITEGGAIPEVSIHDIQYTTDPSGDSPYFETIGEDRRHRDREGSIPKQWHGAERVLPPGCQWSMEWRVRVRLLGQWQRGGDR
jgi:hypothetical protein